MSGPGSILRLPDVVQTAAGNGSLKPGLAVGWCSINSVVMLPAAGSGQWAGAALALQWPLLRLAWPRAALTDSLLQCVLSPPKDARLGKCLRAGTIWAAPQRLVQGLPSTRYVDDQSKH